MSAVDDMTLDELDTAIAGLAYMGNYTRQIGNAWLLVEGARAAGYSPSVQWDDDDGLGNPCWMCWLPYFGEAEDEFVEYTGTGQTAPEAICRAWLKWRRNER